MQFISRNKNILIVLSLAFILRVYGINFGLPRLHPHGDEVLTFAKIFGSVKVLDEDFQQSPLTPFHDFLKILLFIFNTIRETFGYSPLVTDIRTDVDLLYILGRFISVVVSTSSIFLLYLIVQKIFNKRIALSSALILSLTFIDVQVAHYLKQDVYVQFLELLIFWLCLLFLKKQNYLLLYLASIILGITTAIKINVLIITIVFIFVFIKEIKTRLKSDKQITNAIFETVLDFLPCFLFFSLSFFVSNWRMFTYPTIGEFWSRFFLTNKQGAFPDISSQVEASTADGIPSFLWWTLYLFFTGFGPFLFVSVIGGLLIFVRKLFVDFLPLLKTTFTRNKSVISHSAINNYYFAKLSIFSISFLYLIVLFSKRVHFDRHIILITPYLAIFGAVFVDKLLRMIKHKKLIYLFLIVTFAFSLFKILAFDYLISLKDTRILATEKIINKLPVEKGVLVGRFSEGIFWELIWELANEKRLNITSLAMKDDNFILLQAKQGAGYTIFRGGRKINLDSLKPFADYFVVSSVGTTTAKNYQNLDSYKDLHGLYVELEEKGKLIGEVSYFLFDKQFFAPHFLSQGATVNDYHNPTVKIYQRLSK